ncbi:MAG TPA: hypothetical protein P5136_00165 [Methanofastidiosum sp.]|nr:hypothetical protein [Methanofastidiosum sp.]
MAWTAYTDSGTQVTGLRNLTGSTTIGTASYIDSTSATANIYYVPNQYYTFETNLGVQAQFDVVKEKDTRVIHPRLYFKFVKSKMMKMQQKELNERLLKLQQLVVQAKDLGQKSLYEELARKIAITIKEQEINVCGIEYTVHSEAINKYRHKVKGPTIGFCKLENYTRPVPANVKKRIDKCKELKLFDQYWVLYLEYKDKLDVDGKKKAETTEKKTTKEKIKEKDPILFGVQEYLPDKYYFIIDWIDEYCDLTLDKFVQTIKKDDPEYDLDKIDEINEDLLKKLVQESRDRHQRLTSTNRNNFKQLMEEEEKTYTEKAKKYVDKLYPKATKLREKLSKRMDKINDQLNKLMKKNKKGD